MPRFRVSISYEFIIEANSKLESINEIKARIVSKPVTSEDYIVEMKSVELY